MTSPQGAAPDRRGTDTADALPPEEARAAAERATTELLRLTARGERREVERYLSSLPAELREECRRRAETAAAPAAAVPPGAPRVPGYRLERQLGEGSLGCVYAAWDETLERRVALKVLKRGTSERSRERILREARRAAALEDPAVVTVHSVAEGGEAPAIVMELVEGLPLDRAVQALGWRDRAGLLEKLARALSRAHDRGIIHRDLKPANILVTPELQPKILDFGLALSSREGEAREGLFEGTPLYSSPEQARGEPLTSASDVFSFGAVLFTVLTGRPPFSGQGLTEILQQVIAAEPPFPRRVVAGIPEDLQAICLACMAKEAAQRPPATEVAADLGRYLAGEPTRLRPALYGDILRRRIAEHTARLEEWRDQGMISAVEADRLDGVYRRILADEDHWIVDARKLSHSQTALYTGTWMAVVATALLVWIVRDDISSGWRCALLSATAALLVGAGLWARYRREVLAAAGFLAGAVLALAPTVLSLLAEWRWLAAPAPGVTQLLAPHFTNAQAVAAAASGLAVSLLAFWRLELTGFAWTTALFAAVTHVAVLLPFGFLDWDPEVQAFACLPLAALEVVALGCERLRRFRWALPFHLLALAALVGCLDVIAFQGPTLSLLGLRAARGADGGYLDMARLRNLSLALNGLIFLATMLGAERARSLDLRRGARLLQVIVPLHLLGSLYLNAAAHRGAPWVGLDFGLYAGAVAVVLLLGPRRTRQPFLLAGLAGVAIGSHLALDLALVGRAPFVLALGAIGLATAAAAYWLVRRGSRGR